ncbi:hypothetical protein KEM55_006401 [Ascosphaera atra]|nr:hypothetical protein KEM55_006401 [Ascosphaera atra]
MTEQKQDKPPASINIKRGDELSDLTIKCQEASWRVHKVAICASSQVISKALSKDFKERSDGVYEIAGFNARTVDKLLDYFYYKDYDTASQTKGTGKSIDDMLLDVELVEAANVYWVQGLKDLAVRKFTDTLGTFWEVGWYCELANKCYATSSGLDKRLRHALVEAGKKHFKELRDNEVFKTLDQPQFLRDLFQAKLEESNDRYALAMAQLARSNHNKKSLEGQVRRAARVEQEQERKIQSLTDQLEQAKASYASRPTSQGHAYMIPSKGKYVRKVIATAWLQKKCRRCNAKEGFEMAYSNNLLQACCVRCKKPVANGGYIHAVPKN